MKRIFFLCCMIAATLSFAKKWDATYMAKLIANGGIDKVIQYYQEKYYGPDRDPQDAFKIAELYVKKKDYPTAMQWYDKEKQLIYTSKVNLFNYANTCRLMGEYQKALDGYLMYAAQTGDVNKVMDYANQCERVLKASALADNFKLENYTYNTPADETNLSVLRTNPVYITVASTGNKDEVSFTPHQVVRDYQNFAEPVDVLNSVMEKLTVTGITYTRDGNTVAFSARDNNATGGKNKVKLERIFIADNLGGNFLHIKAFPFNMEGYFFKRPAFNDDGTVLYFSSNQPGGSGGYDIWKSSLVNGSWTKPVNLGGLLNSKANELNPFVVQDQKNNELYFSSDREGGFGGYDIYTAKNIDNIWQDVEMQPAPINSSADDISVIYDNEINTGYVSSDRSGGKGGFDVYRFTPFNLKLIIHAGDSTSGTAIDYALVQLTENGVKVNEAMTNDNGDAIFQVGKDKTFSVNISKDNYRPVTLSVNSIGKLSGDSVVTNSILKKDAKFSISNGATNNLSMDNYITFTGQVMDASTNKPAKFAKMRMVNYSTQKLRELDLDQDGRFQIKLLLNNSYKVIFENQEYKVTDELTTYGLDKYDVKVRDYLLSGTKLKLLQNQVYAENNLPSGIKVDTKRFDPLAAYQNTPRVETTPPVPVSTTPVKAKTVVKSTAPIKPTPAATKPTPVKPAVQKILKTDTLLKVSKPVKDTVIRKITAVVKPTPAKIVKADTITSSVVIKDTITSSIVLKDTIASVTSPQIETAAAVVTPIKTAVEKIEKRTVPEKKDTLTLEESIAIWKEKVKKEGIAEPKGAGIESSKTVSKPIKASKMKTVETKSTMETPATEEDAAVVIPPVAPPAPAVPEKPAQKDVAGRPDIYYKIQLGSYNESTITFPEFDAYGKVETVQSYGQYIYRLGNFYTLDNAKTVLDKVRAQGYYVAFVLQYNKDKVTGIVK